MDPFTPKPGDEQSDDQSAGRKNQNLSMRDLRGIVPAIPGRTTSDFEDQIEEALEEVAERIVDAMREQ